MSVSRWFIGYTEACVAVVRESPEANSVTSWPRFTSSSVSAYTMRSGPPWPLGWTLEAIVETCAIRIVEPYHDSPVEYMNMPDPNIERLPKETLRKMIQNAPDTRLFNSLFVRYKDSGEVKDACNDGEYSCAFFVSSLLTLTGYLERPHATVAGLREKMLGLPIQKVELADAQAGDVIFWDKIVFDNGEANEPVGF